MLSVTDVDILGKLVRHASPQRTEVNYFGLRVDEPSGSLSTPCLEHSKSEDPQPVYGTLMFRASRNTDRIHLYTKVSIMPLMWLESCKRLPFSCFNEIFNFINKEIGTWFLFSLRLVLNSQW